MRPPEKLEASVRDCRMHLDISPGGDMELQKTPGRAWLRYIVAITLVAIAAGLRIWPLQALDLKCPKREGEEHNH